jgi:predicted MFS family arabinose efflux permease
MVLWIGQVVSTVGARASALAYPLLVLALTGSPTIAGVVGFAQTLPYVLFYLTAGPFIDRWNRKHIMLVADAGRALAMGSLVVALLAGWLSVTQIVLVAFIEGALFIFFQLSESAALPHVVDRAQLSPALAQNQAREYGADLVGQPLGGVLFGLSRMLPFLFSVLTYVVSFLCILLVRPALQDKRERTPMHVLADIREGVGWLVRQRLLRTLVVLIGVTNVVFTPLPLVMIVRAQQLGASPALVGVMFSFLGGGAIVGAISTPWILRRVSNRSVLLGSLWLWTVQLAVLPLLGDPIWLGVAVATTWLTGPAFNVLVGLYRYALTPDHLQGRTQSAARFMAWGTIPLGNLVGGLLVGSIGPVSASVVLAGAMALIAAAASALPSVRHAPQTDSLEPVS